MAGKKEKTASGNKSGKASGKTSGRKKVKKPAAFALGHDPLTAVGKAASGDRKTTSAKKKIDSKGNVSHKPARKPVKKTTKKPDSILVTGGSGLIGNHVVRMLLERGYKVRCMVMPGENRQPFDGMDVELCEGSLTDHAGHARLLDHMDGLIHLAAIYALWLPDIADMYRVNVEGTRHLLQTAQRMGIGKVVYTSSIAALGVRADGTPGNEDDAFNQWSTANDYVWSKYQSELEVRLLIANGLPGVIVNPCFPMGAGDRAPTPTGEIILNVLRGRLLGYLRHSGFNVVDVEDVAMGHVLAYEKGRVGRRYLLGNTNISQRDLIKMIQKVAGVRKVADRAVPFVVYKTLARGMEVFADWTGKTPLSTVKTLETARQYLYYDCSRAVKELGLPQTPIEESLGKAIAWFRENDYI